MQVKKTLAGALAVLLLLAGLAGCGKKPGTSTPQSDSSSTVSDNSAPVLPPESGAPDVTGDTSDPTATGDTSGTQGGKQTGSSGTKATGNTSKTNGNTSATKAPAPTGGGRNDSSFSNEKKVFKEVKKDLGGITIRLASPWFEWVQSSNCPPYQVAAAKAMQQIAKDYNCKIEMVKVESNFNDLVASNFAGGKIYADIIETQGQPTGLYKYMEDVSKVPALGLTTNDWDAFIGDSATFKGVQYGVGFMMTQNLAVSQVIIAFNKTLADRYGVGDLFQMVRDGKWTYDAFEKASKTAVEKSGGKTKGLIGQIYSSIGVMVHTNDTTLVRKSGENYVFAHDDKNLLAALNFWSDYCKKGYMLDHSSVDYGASSAKLFMQGKTLFMLTDYIGTSTWFNSQMEDEYGVLPLPKGPNAKGYTTVAGTKYFMLTRENKNIDGAARVLVAMANRTGWDMNEWDTVQLETALRDEESLEMMKKYLLKGNFVNSEKARMGLTDRFIDAVLDVIYKGKSAAQAMQEIKSSQNASLLEVYK